MYIQVIPDIHDKIWQADEIIEKEKADKIVFLGDYFDSDNNSLETTVQTAEWLKESLKDKNRIHLMGNHDLSYFRPYYACAGFTQFKLFAVNYTRVDLGKLTYYCWVGDWLCTHAGLSYDFYNEYASSGMNVNDLLENYSQDKNYIHRLYECSSSRGGTDKVSGILWCDYDEFVDIPDVKQIFGHTHGEIRQTENHICIDTWLKNYGLYNTETDEMVIKSA